MSLETPPAALPILDHAPEASVRELLRLSQTDVTADSQLAFLYAHIAYSRSWAHPDPADPTACGEAATKAGLRKYETGADPSIVAAWFGRANDALPSTMPGASRELVATQTLAGRVLGHGGLRLGRSEAIAASRKSFAEGGYSLGQLGPHDRYGVMHLAHWAVLESVSPRVDQRSHRSDLTAEEVLLQPEPSKSATILALHGIKRALSADHEQDSKEVHRQFVIKHLKLNLVALGLSTTRFLVAIKPIQTVRLAVAKKILMPHYQIT